jgi:hypothetical protein
MSFAQLSLPLALAGAAALAGVLYMLQRLRVRHRDVTVVTTLFWHQAVEETRARVLVQRFRHPLAYLLILLIALLLWFGALGPERDAEDERAQVVLLDASAGMDWGTRFEEAKEALLEVAASLPANARTVIACGAAPRTLLLPGENDVLLEERLRDLTPDACPATLQAELASIAIRRGDAPTDVIVVGDGAVDEGALALLPTTLTTRRIERGGEAEVRGPNTGITALGVSPAASGVWNRIDVLVQLAGDGAETALLEATLDGAPLDAQLTRDGGRLLLADVPAAGGRLALHVSSGGALSLDDDAQLTLPDRPLLRVSLSGALSELRPVLAADPAVTVTSDRPDVMLLGPGETGPAGVPALRFVPRADQEQAFLLEHSSDDDSHAVLAAAFHSLGLDEIDGTGLAEAAAEPIRVGAQAAGQRGISVWSSLLTPEFNFTSSRTYPLFVARAVRWLGDEDEFLPYASAGSALAGRNVAHISADDIRLDPLGAGFVPSTQGVYRSVDGDVIDVSLQDPPTTLGLAASLLGGAEPGADAGTSLLRWMLLLALALIALEWHLYRTQRLP